MRKFLLLVIILSSGSSFCPADGLLEYQVKAVCVLNAARFVSWPATAFSSADAPLIIGVVGDNPFGSSLQNVVKGETIQERRIVVRRVTPDDLRAVHILVISYSERDRLEELLRTLNGASVLTISELDRFTQSGGMLGLSLVRGKIRFQVNADAARRAQLKFASQFLLLARTAK